MEKEDFKHNKDLKYTVINARTANIVYKTFGSQWFIERLSSYKNLL